MTNQVTGVTIGQLLPTKRWFAQTVFLFGVFAIVHFVWQPAVQTIKAVLPMSAVAQKTAELADMMPDYDVDLTATPKKGKRG